jgi:hypothetical protein
LSLMEMDAVRFPAAVGVNVTLIVQLAPGRTEVPQVFVCAKSAASAPVMVTPIIESVAFGFVLLSVSVCAALVVPTR